jgi:hypothetical protein
MRHAIYFLGLSLGAAALGCSSSTATTTTIARPELVAISPDDFVNELSAADKGMVHSYVATLFDVTPAADGGVPNPGFQLASSPPTALSLPVTFSFVVTNHTYLAQVDVYEGAPPGGPDAGAAGDADAGAAGGADAGAAGTSEGGAAGTPEGGAAGNGGAAGAPEGGAASDGAGSPDDAGSPDAGVVTHIAPSAPGGRIQFDEHGIRVTPRWVFTCGGYPPTPDGGSVGGAAAVGQDFPAGAPGDDGSFPPGIIAYDGLTQTLHDCRLGLRPVTN